MTVCYQLIFGWTRPSFNMRMSFLGFWAAELSKNVFWEFIAAGKIYIFSWNAQTTNITHVDKSRFTCACFSLLRWDRTHGFRMRKGWLDIWQIVPRAPGPPDTHMTYIVYVFSALERQGVYWGEAHSAHTLWEAEKGPWQGWRLLDYFHFHGVLQCVLLCLPCFLCVSAISSLFWPVAYSHSDSWQM